MTRSRPAAAPSRRTRCRPQGRNAQLLRLLGILRDLARLDGVTVYELAERYGATVRTIRRDLDALEEAGVPLAGLGTDDRKKKWSVSSKEQLARLAGLVDASHYLALRVAMDEGGAVKGVSSLFASLEDLATRLEGALGKRGRDELRAIDACFLSRERWAYRESPPDVLWPLIEAIRGRRLCRVEYQAPRVPTRAREFRVLPLRLFVHDGAVYLYGHVPRYDSVVTLNLQRLKRLTVLAEQGRVPRGFDAEKLAASAFGVFSGGRPTTYRLRFCPEVAPLIRERRWHSSETLGELEDGGVELTFTCGESYEVGAWVASWGKAVVVVAPRRLRKEMRELGEFYAESYR